MHKVALKSQGVKKYDLARRTTQLSIQTLLLLRKVPLTSGNYTIINQLSRSVTSIGANYLSADGAESRADFFHYIAVCQKEAKQSEYWLKVLSETAVLGNEYRALFREIHELILIFSSIRLKTRKIQTLNPKS